MLLGVDSAQFRVGSDYSGNSSEEFVEEFVNCIFTKGYGQNTGVAGGSSNSDSIWDTIWKALREWGSSSANAKKDVSDSNNRIRTAEASVREKQADTTKSITEIMNSIKGNISSINSALERIEKLSGDSDGGFEEIQKELECEKEIITQNILILKDSNSSQEDKEKALKEIEGCNERITGLLVQVEDIEKEIGELNKSVESYTSNIEEQQDNAANIIADALGVVENITSQAEREGTVNTQIAAQGGVEEVEGETGVAAAATAEVVSEGTATVVVEEAETNSIDRIASGGERIKGSAENFTQLGTSLSEIEGDFSTISELSNSIGSLSNDAADLIGSYTYFSEPMITSVGSWKSQVQSGNTLLGVAVTNYRNGEEDDLLNFEADEQFGSIEG